MDDAMIRACRRTPPASLWPSTAAPSAVPGYSAVRWHNLAKIQLMLSEHFDKIAPFIDKLHEHRYDEAARQRMRVMVDDSK